MSFTHKALPWLLEEGNPTIRYLALKNLVGLGDESKELKSAHEESVSKGYINEILDKMNPEGFWVKPGTGYNPKYKGGVWSLITLALLGAKINDDERIKRACNYYLDNAFAADGHISINGTPSGTIDCLQGNMCAALYELGVEDERLNQAFDWLADSQIGVIASNSQKVKYYAYKCGSKFACGANGKLPCSWGAVKVLYALGKLPKRKRTANTQKAIDLGVEFLLSVDPSTAKYPTRGGTSPNRTWWNFGFPVFYITDLLQNVEALVSVGLGKDTRLSKSIEMIKSKEDDQGRWPLEYDYARKVWSNFGVKNEPNKFVTYRALRVLKDVSL